MKNPKWREAYPQGHKVKFGNKFLTTWAGYNLTLLPSEYGTISGDKLVGYQDDVCNLTAYPTTLLNEFQGYDLTGAGYIQNNQYTYVDGNATAQGRFVNNNSALIYSGGPEEYIGTDEVKFSGELPPDAWIAIKVDRRISDPGWANVEGISAEYTYAFGGYPTYQEGSGVDFNLARLLSWRARSPKQNGWKVIDMPEWYWSNVHGERFYDTNGYNGAYVWEPITSGSQLKHASFTESPYSLSSNLKHNLKLVCPYSGENSYFYIDGVMMQQRYQNFQSVGRTNWALHNWSGAFDCSVGGSTGRNDWHYAQGGGYSGTCWINQFWSNHQVAVFKDFSAADQW